MRKFKGMLLFLLLLCYAVICTGCASVVSNTTDVEVAGVLSLSFSEEYSATDAPEEYANFSSLTSGKIAADSTVEFKSSTTGLSHSITVTAEDITLKDTDIEVTDTAVTLIGNVDIAYSGLYKSAVYEIDLENLKFELSDGSNTYTVVCEGMGDRPSLTITTIKHEEINEIVLSVDGNGPYADGEPPVVSVHSVNGETDKNYLISLMYTDWKVADTFSENSDDYSVFEGETLELGKSYCAVVGYNPIVSTPLSAEHKVYLLLDGEKIPVVTKFTTREPTGSYQPKDEYDAFLFYENIEARAVSSVSVGSEKAEVLPGETAEFSADVVGSGYVPKDVAWTVSGNSSAETKIDENGLLTVGIDETATSLTITATSAYDNTKSGELTISVIQRPTAAPTLDPTPTVSPTDIPAVTSSTTPTPSDEVKPSPSSVVSPAPKVKKTVKFVKKKVTIKKGKKKVLKVKITGAKKAKFSVNKNGKKAVKLLKKKAKRVTIKGKKKGKATIIAKVGKKKAKCKVKVK